MGVGGDLSKGAHMTNGVHSAPAASSLRTTSLRSSLRATIAVCFAALAAFAPAGCKDKEAERVEQTVATLSNASAAQDADKIVSLLTPGTIEMYGEHVRLARTARKDELLRSGYSAASTALRLRLEYSEPQLRKMTGESLIREMVTKSGWSFLFDDTENFELGPAVVSGDSAKLALSERVEQPVFRGRGSAVASLLFGKKKGLTFQVYLVKDDDNIWRLDETSMIQMDDRLVEDFLSEVRISLEAALNDAFEGDDGNPAPKDMWTPPKAGAKALRPSR